MEQEVDSFRVCSECERYFERQRNNNGEDICPVVGIKVYYDTDAKDCVHNGDFKERLFHQVHRNGREFLGSKE